LIRSLRLRNFKCFHDRTLPLGDLTLLCGLNGTGKSSVLQALLLLRQSHQQGLLVGGRLALNGELAQVGTARDALYEEAEEESIGFEVAWEDGRRAAWNFLYDREADVLAAKSVEAPDTIFLTNLFVDAFQYLCAERLGPRSFFATSDFAVRQHRQIGPRGEFAAQFLAVYGHQRVSLGSLLQEASSALLKDQAEAWLGMVSPGARLQVTPYSGMDLIHLEYSFVSGKDVSRPYRPTNVGFGITYALPILVAVLSAEPGALVLIENPEAHLHPRGQVAMGSFLSLAASAGVQLIVETHSDHVLNGIRLAVHRGKLQPGAVLLHFFKWSGSEHEVITPSIDREGRIDVWPDDFFDEWDKSLEALLQPPSKLADDAQ
jgi:predicted ATPase